jgi:hypothetical protein
VLGDSVFLKLQHYVESSVAVRANHELSFKYFGPFLIINKVGTVVYKLQLPAESQVHPVFHVSQLKKAMCPHRQVIETLPSSSNAFMVPLKVFDHRWRRKGNNCIKQVLTRWA